MSIAELVRRRLREPRRLVRQLVVGEAIAERPRRGLAPVPAPPPAPSEPPADQG